MGTVLLALLAGECLAHVVEAFTHESTDDTRFAGRLAKGEPDVLVRDGRPDRARLRKHRISDQDLLEEARLNGQTGEVEEIKVAVLERNGQISVLPKKTS